MEKNHIIGFILIFATLMLWSIATAPSEEELAKTKRMRDSIEQAQLISIDTLNTENFTAEPTVAAPQNDSLTSLANAYAFGPFASAASGKSKDVVLENGDLKITFDTKGGRMKAINVKNYKSVSINDKREEVKGELILFDNEEDQFAYELPVSSLPAKVISSSDLYFTPTKNGNTVSLKAPVNGGGYIEQVYKLSAEGFKLDYDLKLVGLDNIIDRNADAIKLDWVAKLNKLEKGEEFEQRYSTIYFKENDEGNADYCKCISDDVESPKMPIDWVSHSNQFFNTTLIAREKPFTSGVMETVMADVDVADHLKTTSAELMIPYGHGSNESFTMEMYLGPNEYKNLAAFDIGLEQIIPFGNSVFGSINRHVIRPFFNFLSSLIGSKGLVILIMIFLVKMLLYPLMYKMLKSQALMGALKPQLAHLTDKYKDDAQKKQVETMKIYKEYGVSPFGGCMPMVIQIPIWYALFRFFPASISFRQESFLWATDLSSYDDFFHLPFSIPFVGDHLSLFTILYSVSMLIYTYYNTRHMDMSANPAMKYVQYLMPVMFFGFFNNYASGLTCYMFFSNVKFKSL